MASAIEDVSSLPGEKVVDQEGTPIGEVKDIYTVGENEPMWVTIEASTGMRGSKVVFVPLARLKEENDEISVPYSAEHIKKSPEIEAEDELSEEDDRTLRDYYAIDHADQELRTDNESYATRVPEGDGPAKKTSADDVKDYGSDDSEDSEKEESSKAEGSDDSEDSEQEESSKAEGSDDSEDSEQEESSKAEGSDDSEGSEQDESPKGEGSDDSEGSEDESPKGEGSDDSEGSEQDESPKGEGSDDSEGSEEGSEEEDSKERESERQGS